MINVGKSKLLQTLSSEVSLPSESDDDKPLEELDELDDPEEIGSIETIMLSSVAGRPLVRN